MDEYWLDEFKKRIIRFSKNDDSSNKIPVSIKIRVTSGCFHREHSPNAYIIIDDYLKTKAEKEDRFDFIEHESGPEILVYLTIVAGFINLSASIINLITTILKARNEGHQKGDRPNDPLDIIFRGLNEQGEYFEEKTISFKYSEKIEDKQIIKTIESNSKIIRYSDKKK
jgi:hypothetical protein